MAYDSELKGVLFKNEDKQSDTHADYRGNVTVNGVEYFLDAWINEADSGRKYMSLRLKQKEKQAAPAAKQAPRRQSRDDEAPF